MGASFYRLRCEVFQNLFLSPMNTGFVRPAVATVLTVYGIETILDRLFPLQWILVATVLTVYGIETESKRANIRRFELVATVLTVYGIETTGCTPVIEVLVKKLQQYLPFTVLKLSRRSLRAANSSELQQYLPFTVLKLFKDLWH